MKKIFLTIIVTVIINIFYSGASAKGLEIQKQEAKHDNVCKNKRLYGLAKYYNGANHLDNYLAESIPTNGFNNRKIVQCRYYVKTIDIKNSSFDVVNNISRADSFNVIERYIYLFIIEARNTFNSWVLSIITLAFLIKLILMPLSALQIRASNHVSMIKSKVEPVIYEIKKNFKGEEAHNKILKFYNENNISQLYEVKPLLFIVLQLPVLIIIFKILPFMIEFQNEKFLWIDDLSYPDYILDFDFVIPFFGDGLHLLPFILLIMMIFSPSTEKKNYLLYLAVFVAIYTFPSVLLLYFIISIFLKEIEFYLLTRKRSNCEGN